MKNNKPDLLASLLEQNLRLRVRSRVSRGKRGRVAYYTGPVLWKRSFTSRETSMAPAIFIIVLGRSEFQWCFDSTFVSAEERVTVYSDTFPLRSSFLRAHGTVPKENRPIASGMWKFEHTNGWLIAEEQSPFRGISRSNFWETAVISCGEINCEKHFSSVLVQRACKKIAKTQSPLGRWKNWTIKWNYCSTFRYEIHNLLNCYRFLDVRV